MARYFGLDILSTAIMSSHLHQILRTRPDLVKRWSANKVARHWLYLYPKRRDKNGQPCKPTDKEIAAITGDKKRLKTLRKRLSSLSWFNAYLKEKIARRSNAEDQVTGAFWEKRFSSVKLDSEAAVLSCSIYVDLNPIRAGVAKTPEESEYTSIWYRLRARRARDRHRRSQQKRSTMYADRDADRWLSPITDRPLPAQLMYGQQGHRISDDPGLPIPLEQYLQLLDWTGRQLRKGKRGAIPAELADILTRLQIEPAQWLSGMQNFAKMFRRVAGTAVAIMQQARKAGRRWFHGLSHARQFFQQSAE